MFVTPVEISVDSQKFIRSSSEVGQLNESNSQFLDLVRHFLLEAVRFYAFRFVNSSTN